MKWLVTDTLRGDAYPRYAKWLSRLSIQAVRASPQQAGRDLEPFAALLLTGGGDVDPARYGQPRAPETRHVRLARDDLEFDLIMKFLQARRPVFGVCRGIQALNVALRGGLIQHLPAYLAARGAADEQHGEVDGKDSFHALRCVEGCVLADVLAGASEVNSAHHQAVDPDAVGNGVRVAAISGAGVVEALEGMDRDAPVLAVQWHPERLPFKHPASSDLLRHMREMAASSRRG